LGRHGMYLPTVAWHTAMPSLSSSPWMRGAPQSGLAMLIGIAPSFVEIGEAVAANEIMLRDFELLVKNSIV
jgi:hypothetical protein